MNRIREGMKHSNGSVEKWLGGNFPYFCRRVCRQCHRTDTTELMLQACPVIKLDAYASLQGQFTTAKIARVLRDTIAEIVTAELVFNVSHIKRSGHSGDSKSFGGVHK